MHLQRQPPKGRQLISGVSCRPVAVSFRLPACACSPRSAPPSTSQLAVRHSSPSCSALNCPFHLHPAYDGSSVRAIQLDSFKVFHRLSFGHPNPRTYVVVVYDPASRACRRMETEVGPLSLDQGSLAIRRCSRACCKGAVVALVPLPPTGTVSPLSCLPLPVTGC